MVFAHNLKTNRSIEQTRLLRHLDLADVITLGMKPCQFVELGIVDLDVFAKDSKRFFSAMRNQGTPAISQMVSVARRGADNVIQLVLKSTSGLLQQFVNQLLVVAEEFDEHPTKIVTNMIELDHIVQRSFGRQTRHFAEHGPQNITSEKRAGSNRPKLVSSNRCDALDHCKGQKIDIELL